MVAEAGRLEEKTVSDEVLGYDRSSVRQNEGKSFWRRGQGLERGQALRQVIHMNTEVTEEDARSWGRKEACEPEANTIGK